MEGGVFTYLSVTQPSSQNTLSHAAGPSKPMLTKRQDMSEWTEFWAVSPSAENSSPPQTGGQASELAQRWVLGLGVRAKDNQS